MAAWDRLIQQSPEVALRRAQVTLDKGPASDSDRGVLLSVVGRSQFELGRIPAAQATMHAAVSAVAGEGVDEEVRRSVLMTSAVVFAEAGDIDEALANLDVLRSDSEGRQLGRVWLQRAFVLQHAGRLTEAIAALDESASLLRSEGTDQERFRVALNRGLVLLQQSHLEAAEVEFLEAAELARRLGMTAAEGQCYANIGALYGRGRRLVDALQSFDRAARLLDRAGRPDRVTTWMEIDRAEVMMNFGLADDAVAAAGRALDVAAPTGNAMLIGDALMLRARAELRAGQLRQAQRTALDAADLFARTGRSEIVSLAETVSAIAELRRTDEIAPALERSQQLAESLRRLGWHEQADELGVERIRAAWRTGEWGGVADELASLRLHAFDSRRDAALVGWFAEAVARRLSGDAAGGMDACRRGLEFLDDIVAEATDLESRSAAMRLGQDLSGWLIALAVECDDPDTTLAASEGTRARALHDELGNRSRHRPLTEDGAIALRAELRERVGARTLVLWVIAAGRIWAVVCNQAGNRLVDVADQRAAARARDRLLVWLDRSAAEPDGPAAGARRAAAALEALLLGPLGLPEAAGVVMVPVDELHEVPWSGLPSLVGRDVVLSPSCQLWLDADERSSRALHSVGLLAGPDLGADDLERATLARLHPAITDAGGWAATADAARHMLSTCDLVHVAAHGRFRAERPLLSTLTLADGDVTLHQSVPDEVAARLVVLSSCEGGAHLAGGGSEVLGLSSVLLARGAAAVLAPLTIVRDLECAEFVSTVHEELVAGHTVAAAVARVRSRWQADDDLSRWAVSSSFLLFGADSVRLATPSRTIEA